MKNNLALEEHKFYHIYNRGNNGENLFFQDRNYSYFLIKYDFYLSDYLETFAYCLLPNHFHLLVRIKPYEAFPLQKDFPKITENPPFDKLVSERFRRFFMSYAKSIAQQENRTGSLFQKPFKRKEVTDNAYFSRLVYYIHANPQKHGICSDFREYPYSSYGRMLIEKNTKLEKKEVLSWFGERADYLQFHDSFREDNGLNNLILEE